MLSIPWIANVARSVPIDAQPNFEPWTCRRCNRGDAEISLGGTLGTEICWAEPLEQRFPWAEPLEQEPFQIQPLVAPLEMLA